MSGEAANTGRFSSPKAPTLSPDEDRYNPTEHRVRFKLLFPDAKVPVRATEGAVGYDLYAYSIGTPGRTPPKIVIPPRTVRPVKTGIAIALRPRMWAGVYSRSGLAANHAVFVANAPGVIDEDYRGEIGVLLYNGGFDSYYVQHGDRIAQLLFHDVRHPEIAIVDELDPTTRGEQGYGSTGR